MLDEIAMGAFAAVHESESEPLWDLPMDPENVRAKLANPSFAVMKMQLTLICVTYDVANRVTLTVHR